jgi:hypothetical protein
MPDIRRLTWWTGEFSVFIKKEFVTQERLAERFCQIIDSKSRAGQKKSIAEQMKEGAEQAARGDASRPAPAKDTEKDR